LIEELEGRHLVDDFWHSDDVHHLKANTPLNLTTLSCLQLSQTGKPIETIRAELKNKLLCLLHLVRFLKGYIGHLLV
jgi:hypothetical protein